MIASVQALAPAQLEARVTTLVLVVPDEDLARCMALLRRAGFGAMPTAALALDARGLVSRAAVRDVPARYVFGDVELDVGAQQVYRAGQPVRLTPMEFDILVTLARRKGELVRKRELDWAGWSPRTSRVSRRVLATHILNLRHKLELEPNRPRHILTVWGMGYRLVD